MLAHIKKMIMNHALVVEGEEEEVEEEEEEEEKALEKR